MAYAYIIPSWFIGYSVALEVLFAVITIAVAYTSFRIYSLSSQRESRLFGISFYLIAGAYILLSLFNIFLLSDLDDNAKVLIVGGLGLISTAAVYLYAFLFIAGLSLLVYTTLKVKHKRVYSIILSLSLVAILISKDFSQSFHLVSAILLIFVLANYLKACFESRSKKPGLVLSGFTFLFFSEIVAIFLPKSPAYFIFHTLLVLAAYLFILTNLALVLRKKK